MPSSDAIEWEPEIRATSVSHGSTRTLDGMLAFYWRVRMGHVCIPHVAQRDFGAISPKHRARFGIFRDPLLDRARNRLSRVGGRSIRGIPRWTSCSTAHPSQFARDWYPLPLYIFFFEELQGLVHIIFPGWFDRWLIQFDYNFAGVHPSVWMARFSNPALNDFMQFAYMTYFLYLVLLPAILYAQKDRLAFWNVMVSTAVANYTVYAIAVLFPIESPYHTLAALNSKPLVGGYFTATIDLIERFGRVHGGAFPSAHVAGSMVAILASWRYRRWLFWAVPAIFHQHVRGDGLRTLSLCGGCPRRDRCGSDWICGGRLVDGTAWRSS